MPSLEAHTMQHHITCGADSVKSTAFLVEILVSTVFPMITNFAVQALQDTSFPWISLDMLLSVSVLYTHQPVLCPFLRLHSHFFPERLHRHPFQFIFIFFIYFDWTVARQLRLRAVAIFSFLKRALLFSGTFLNSGLLLFQFRLFWWGEFRHRCCGRQW